MKPEVVDKFADLMTAMIGTFAFFLTFSRF